MPSEHPVEFFKDQTLSYHFLLQLVLLVFAFLSWYFWFTLLLGEVLNVQDSVSAAFRDVDLALYRR